MAFVEDRPEPKARLVKAGPVDVPAGRVARIDDPDAPAYAAKTFVEVSRQLGPCGVAVSARDNVFVVQGAGQLPYVVKTASELRAFAGGFLRGLGRLPDPRQAAQGNKSNGGTPENQEAKQ